MMVNIHLGNNVKLGKNAKIEYGAVIYDDCIIGDNSIVGANAVLRPRTIIGENSIFGTLSCSEGDCEIGDYTTIHAQCHITKGVHIYDNVFIAPFFIATNTDNITYGTHGNSAFVPHDLHTRPTIIQSYVRIGANVRMIPGCVIGYDSLIDQDTFITHDVPPHSHVRGGKDKVGRIIGTV